MDREALRRDTQVLAVDNNPESRRMVRNILEENFPGRITYLAKPSDAIVEIVRRAEVRDKGQFDVIVLDMEMPDMTGDQMIMTLARAGITIPTVIFSGTQGDRRRKILSGKLAGAKNLEEIERVVDRHIRRSRGCAITHVTKLDAAVHPERLVDAVDAMLIAGKKKYASLEELLAAEKIPIVCGEEDHGYRRQVLADTSDSFLSFFQRARQITEKIKKISESLDLDDKQRKLLNQHLSMLEQFPVADFEFEGLERKVNNYNQWKAVSHSFGGSYGFAGIYNPLDILVLRGCSQLSGCSEEYKDLVYDIQSFIGSYEEKMCGAFSGNFNLENIIQAELMKNSNRNIVDLEGEYVYISGHPDNLQEALKLAIDNARDAVGGVEKGAVKVRFGKIKVEDLRKDERKHFVDQGYSVEEEVAYMKVADNGPGMNPGVLEAWIERRDIVSTKTHIKAQGLDLMREMAEGFNDGTVTIDSSDTGVEVGFYFGIAERKKE